MSPFGDSMGGGDPSVDAGSPGPGGGYPVDQPAPADPREARAAMKVANIISSARELSTMFPAANSELRDVLNMMSRVQAKIIQSKPAPEPSAPPV